MDPYNDTQRAGQGAPEMSAACSCAIRGAPVHSAAIALQMAGGSGKKGKEATVIRASCISPQAVCPVLTVPDTLLMHDPRCCFVLLDDCEGDRCVQQHT